MMTVALISLPESQPSPAVTAPPSPPVEAVPAPPPKPKPKKAPVKKPAPRPKTIHLPVKAEAEPAPTPVTTAAIPRTAKGAPLGSPPAVPTTPKFSANYLRNPAPEYPAISRRLGEEGKVLLRVLVSPEGRAERVEINQSCGHDRLDQAAQDAVRRWQFIPARLGDNAVRAWVIVPIVFTLKG